VAGTGGGGGAAGTGGGGAGGIGGTTTGLGGTGGIPACQSSQLVFEPVLPTVYLLVSRSGSMFTCLTGTPTTPCPTPTDTSWSTLKEAVRSVVGMVGVQARLGFSTVWGTNPSVGGMCPSLQGMLTDSVAPALGNAAAVMAKYDSLAPPPASTQVGMKFESPISTSVKAVGQALGATTVPGEKYILLVTNGVGDYCDDGNSICPPDSAVWRIQENKTAGITTLVLAVPSSEAFLPMGISQAFANAGAGEPTVAPLRAGNDTFAIFDQCQASQGGWRDDLIASGKPQVRGTTLGTYATTAGPSRAYTPGASDQAEIAARLKTCSYSLGGGRRVDPTKLNLAHVKIGGAEVPLDASNGWSMPTDTEVRLNGATCASWRTPSTATIDFLFPCEAIID
jgi:hypothetical protein